MLTGILERWLWLQGRGRGNGRANCDMGGCAHCKVGVAVHCHSHSVCTQRFVELEQY